MPEPENPYDANAIRVDVNGLAVGHLSRTEALRYGDGLRALMVRHGGFIALNAVIVGGGQGRDHLGVWLQHDPADFGIAPAKPATPEDHARDTPPSLRTGFSEAWVTDEGDDSYDLSWYEELPEDDSLAIAKLQELLPADPDPIDRHYMYTELEKRLYRRGLRDATVLSEFDATCLVHHQEMDQVRSAFIAKWNTLPLLDTYRQMCVRRSKEKNWESCRWWAEQGLQIYGEKATRQEWVTDLETRRDRALAKIKQAAQPAGDQQKVGRSAPVPLDQSAPTVETLTCQKCGADFERVRTRGRKPLMCPTCRP